MRASPITCEWEPHRAAWTSFRLWPSQAGRRNVAQIGNTHHGTLAVLRPLPAGTYYWSVQAIDPAFAGSAFAAESSFTFSPSTLSIGDVAVLEDHSGTTEAVFTVRMSSASLTVTVDYSTANGTASAGADYEAGEGTLTFMPGDTEETSLSEWSVSTLTSRTRVSSSTWSMPSTPPSWTSRNGHDFE